MVLFFGSADLTFNIRHDMRHGLSHQADDKSFFLFLSLPNVGHHAVQFAAHILHTKFVGDEIHAVVFVEADQFACLEGVLIGGEELEVPVVNLLLVLDAFFDILGGELST